jgi:chromate transporter
LIDLSPWRGTIKGGSQIAIALAAAAVMLLTPIGIVPTLLAAGCVGITLFHSRRFGALLLSFVVAGGLAYWQGGRDEPVM